jgi:hypothetical protein
MIDSDSVEPNGLTQLKRAKFTETSTATSDARFAQIQKLGLKTLNSGINQFQDSERKAVLQEQSWYWVAFGGVDGWRSPRIEMHLYG